jgi:hypothetical protein
MKKILFTLFIFELIFTSFSQEATEKKTQAGLIFNTGLNFQQMGTKRIETKGVGTDLTVGANIIYNFKETIGFQSGFEFDFETLKYKSTDYEGLKTYYYYNDSDILPIKDFNSNNSSHKLFQMTERKQNAVYLSIPTMMVFRTKFFGYMRYFGKFGFRNSFLLSNKSNDQGFNFTENIITKPIVSVNQIDMKSKGEMFFFKSALGITGGGEWNFSGSTSLVAELGFYYGFTPLHSNRNIDKENNYFFATNADQYTTNTLPFNNKATQKQLVLKFSILF